VECLSVNNLRPPKCHSLNHLPAQPSDSCNRYRKRSTWTLVGVDDRAKNNTSAVALEPLEPEVPHRSPRGDRLLPDDC